MYSPHYIGFDVHKKIISYCSKTIAGKIVDQGIIAANRAALLEWTSKQEVAWVGAMEATIFTGWVYDFLKPYAFDLKVAHPEMLKAITAAKKKNDAADAEKIADLLRCNLLPECYMLDEELRELRRILRYRNFLVRQAVTMKNKMSGLLMEVGTPYNKKRLHGKKYFSELVENIYEIPSSVIQSTKIKPNQPGNAQINATDLARYPQQSSGD